MRLFIPFVLFLTLAWTTNAQASGCTHSWFSASHLREFMNGMVQGTEDFLWAYWEWRKDDWAKRKEAGERLRELARQGKNPIEAMRIVEAEGLGDYLMSYAGRFPAISGNQLIKFLEKNNWTLLRNRGHGSHFVLKAPSGHIVTVPVHANTPLGSGMLHKILKQAGLNINSL